MSVLGRLAIEALRSDRGWSPFRPMQAHERCRARPVECDYCGAKNPSGASRGTLVIFYISFLESPKGCFGGISLLCRGCVQVGKRWRHVNDEPQVTESAP